MTGAHAYVSLAQASKEGEKRLSALRKVTLGQPTRQADTAKSTASAKPQAAKPVKR